MTSAVELCRWMNVADSCERCWSTCATVNMRVLEGTRWTALWCSGSQSLRVRRGPEVVLWTVSSEAVLLVEVVLCLVWHDPAGLVQLEWSFCFLGCSFSLLLGIMWRRPLLRLLKNWLPWCVGHIHTCGGDRNGCRADAAPIAVMLVPSGDLPLFNTKVTTDQRVLLVSVGIHFYNFATLAQNINGIKLHICGWPSEPWKFCPEKV